ncbi:hypothetical protein SDC9_69783 [bioreactor metagenome]|uniref:EscI/YscI/HrpB family type III secretion system inner rod protein n=1 Tax=bioreactor metagenome TaxID=1076179 RepID=A0A644Y3Z7_9ZZZZ
MDIVNTAALASAVGAAQGTAAATAVSATAAPDALAAARFSEIMAQPVAIPQAADVAQTAAASSLPPAPALSADASVGDRILNGMHKVSEDFRHSFDSVNKMLDATGNNLNVREMLKLQLQLTQVTFQFDMVGKAVSRSTQNLDQLVRVQ